jgi:hypothetical protein
MNCRKVGILFLAVTAVCAIAASSAYAANFVESGSAAYIGPSPGTKLTGTKVLKTEVVPETKMTLSTTVAGIAIKTEAKGYNCLECTIENSGTNAVGHGALEAKEVRVVEPAKCEDGPTIVSKKVRAVLGMKKESSTIATIKFEPAEGTTFETAELKGAECAIAGTYKVTGSVYAEVVNFTGVFAKTQKLRFSQAIQTDAGGAGALQFGANAAFVTAEAQGSLEGGSEWAAKEK